MINIDCASVLLSKAEYDKLVDPDKTYSLITKTIARNVVKKILKDSDKVCWNDTDEDYEDGCCGMCCIMNVLGREAGQRMCDRPKRWSK